MGFDGTLTMRFGIYALALGFPAIPVSLAARDVAIDVPAGTVANSVISIARQTGTSIVVSHPVLAERRSPRIRGRMGAAEAVRRLARSVGGEAVRVGKSSWKIVPRPMRSAPRSSRPKPLPAPARPAALEPPPPIPEPGPPIVVTASKRDTRLTELAAQVAIIDGESLELGGVGGTEKITQRIATVSSTHLGSGRNKLFIRGIADSSFTGPTQATVGQYLGDLRLSYNAPDPDLRLSDLERVEVLEGPQGTLYGAGSLGGIIRLVPHAPELDVASIRGMTGAALTQHGAPGGDLSAVANIPLRRERAALRLSIDASREGGYIDKPNLARINVNRADILAGRASVHVELDEDWTVELLGLAQSSRAEDSQYADRGGAPLESSAQVQEGSEAEYLHGQFVVSGLFRDIEIRSTSGFARQELQERYDATAPNGPDRLFLQRNDTRMLAHETRFWVPLSKRFGWLAGLSLIDNRTRLTRSLGSPESRSASPGVLNTITEATVYGEASYRLRDSLIATIGARYTHAWLGGSGQDVAEAFVRTEITASRKQGAFLPSASLLAEVAPATSLFVRYQEGFRPGGLAIQGNFVSRFEQDRAATLEFGLRHGRPKRDPFDLTLSVSHTRWSDIQADFIDELGLPSTANIGDGRVWTASSVLGVYLLPELRLEAGATFNESRIDEPSLALFSRTNHVPNIARFSGRLGLEYSARIARDLDLRLQAWASYIGKSRLGIGPELGELQGDYFDSGLLVRIARDRLGATISVTNLADVQGNRFALGTPFVVGRDQVTPLRPRTIRLGVDFSF